MLSVKEFSDSINSIAGFMKNSVAMIRKKDGEKIQGKFYKRLPRKIRKNKILDFSGSRNTGYYKIFRTK